MSRKKEKEKKEEKIYPSLVLGLDISTACIGVSIVYDDGVKEPEIVKITHVVPKLPSKIKGIEALILRKKIFEEDFLTTIKDMGITECIIEAPLNYATGNSNTQTVTQLVQFNGLLSEAVYRVLGIVPTYMSSYEARMLSFPELLSIRKFNKKGIVYPYSHIRKALDDNHLVLFGDFPFDCDKKEIMMNCVREKYPEITWVYDNNGKLKKENYDACDSLVCALAYIQQKRYGELDAKVTEWASGYNGDDDSTLIKYTMNVWGKNYKKSIFIKE